MSFSTFTESPTVSHHFTMMGLDHKFYSLEEYAKMREEKKNRPIDVILKEAVKEKNLGNASFQRGNFDEALDRYHAAIEDLPTPKLNKETDLWEDNEPKELSELRAVLCNNIAACHIKRNEFDMAVGYATNTLKTNGFQNNAKALYRRAYSNENLGKYEEALRDYFRVVENAPDNEEALEAIPRLQKLSHSYEAKEQELKTAENMSCTIIPHPCGVNDLEITKKTKTATVVRMSVPSGTEKCAMALLDTNLSNGIYLLQLKMTTLYYRIVAGVYQHTKSMPYPDYSEYSSSLGYQSDGRIDQSNHRYFGCNPWQQGDVVTMEVDTTNRTLHFLVNRALQPVSFSQLPPSIRFFVELWEEGDAFQVQSLKRLPNSSITAATPRAPCYESSGHKRSPRVVPWGKHEDNFFS